MASRSASRKALALSTSSSRWSPSPSTKASSGRSPKGPTASDRAGATNDVMLAGEPSRYAKACSTFSGVNGASRFRCKVGEPKVDRWISSLAVISMTSRPRWMSYCTAFKCASFIISLPGGRRSRFAFATSSSSRFLRRASGVAGASMYRTDARSGFRNRLNANSSGLASSLTEAQGTCAWDARIGRVASRSSSIFFRASRTTSPFVLTWRSRAATSSPKSAACGTSFSTARWALSMS
mmetsp:Transcript_17405/g.49678  ORF Transcript_17405/g.49678 Transcript_17405/m.49678 type:complete len:238 (+) Transcript_17405:487-1200(+)